MNDPKFSPVPTRIFSPLRVRPACKYGGQWLVGWDTATNKVAILHYPLAS